MTDIGGGGAAAVARIAAQPGASLALAAPPAPAPVQAAAASPPNLIRWLQGVVGRGTNGIGSLAFNSLQALEALLTGPPVLPPNSTVTVRNSTILLSTGQRVRANWYYPEGEEVPEKLIVLQHGFFALGPMYSFTAANLAESTGAIVVTPTISSNPFGGDDNWINGSGMAAAIADLFVGDRQALTDSALAAGFATRYGLDPAQAQLPEKFGLAGHSAGAGLVSAVAGYLVDKGAADDLVGVITLDGVPTGNTMAVALAKLAAYEDATGRYIPVREIGAPRNAFNFISTLKADLNAARPGRFNGVVLSGGVHMDSMKGGNALIQFGAYLIAGFPQPQNPPAVAQLSAEWFNDWFAGDTDNGDDLAPGSTLPIATPNGTAQGTVIGSFAGATSDAFTLFERLEAKLEQYPDQLMRAAVELAKDWRTDRYLRRLEAMMIVADKKETLVVTGTGDVLTPDKETIAIGSGGNYAYSAAQALAENTELDAEEIARKAMKIAAEICVYTNENVTVETIELD